jgi:hypothetical protein
MPIVHHGPHDTHQTHNHTAGNAVAACERAHHTHKHTVGNAVAACERARGWPHPRGWPQGFTHLSLPRVRCPPACVTAKHWPPTGEPCGQCWARRDALTQGCEQTAGVSLRWRGGGGGGRGGWAEGGTVGAGVERKVDQHDIDEEHGHQTRTLDMLDGKQTCTQVGLHWLWSCGLGRGPQVVPAKGPHKKPRGTTVRFMNGAQRQTRVMRGSLSACKVHGCVHGV